MLIKSLAVVTALTVGSTSAAYADGPTVVQPVLPTGISYDFVGDIHYEFEAQHLHANAGVEVSLGNGFYVTPYANFRLADNDFTFRNAGLLGEYDMSDSVTLYADINVNENFEYREFTVGSSFRF